MEKLSTYCITASSMNMSKKQCWHISQEGGLHVDEYCWTINMASLSTYHLGLWLGWLILLNLVKS